MVERTVLRDSVPGDPVLTAVTVAARVATDRVLGEPARTRDPGRDW